MGLLIRYQGVGRRRIIAGRGANLFGGRVRIVRGDDGGGEKESEVKRKLSMADPRLSDMTQRGRFGGLEDVYMWER